MEKLKYIVEDRTIAEILGVQNFTNADSAFLEIIKNAYDAQATLLEINFEHDEITIKDDGIGMNLFNIKEDWMHIGKSQKKYFLLDEKGNKRILAGSKGIGRFALARLGSRVTLFSKKRGERNVIKWTTDWTNSQVDEIGEENLIGTKIVISDLRDKWNKKHIDRLINYLSRTYNDHLMKVIINYKEFENPKVVKPYFLKAIKGINCTSIINLDYSSDSCELTCTIDSDEFLDEAKNYCENINLTRYTIKLNCFEELINHKDLRLTSEELKEVLIELGSFKSEFYFSLKEPSVVDKEKFLYKYNKLPERFESGIILYRNAFSISSFEGVRDWLGISKRARLSPAAATHPTGSWRVRENQLSGKVEIDKQSNYMLKDLSNRQGLDENIYYDVLLEIISKGIAEFERYRQSIIRKINHKNLMGKKDQVNYVDSVIKNPNKIQKMSKAEVLKFVQELKDVKSENQTIKREINSTEDRYKYDVRILNVLATSGLKASAIAHELHNDRNSISQNYDNIVKAMELHGIWDYVNESKRTKYAFSNIPQLLMKNKKINDKIGTFMSTMLSDVEKEHFIPNRLNVFELLNDIKFTWERDYSWLEIQIDAEEDVFFVLPADVINVIFDNLVLNSIQHNEDRNRLLVSIKMESNDGTLEFSYKDNGRGLDRKYIKNPNKILEVHETSRQQGHGLGMWIVNNTIIMSGGSINSIDGNGGFFINFTLGGKFNGII